MAVAEGRFVRVGAVAHSTIPVVKIAPLATVVIVDASANLSARRRS
jgi:hypothetical protein